MSVEVRLAFAVLYALLMAADVGMELTGRYERAGARLPALPFCAAHRVLSAWLWVGVHALFLLCVLGVVPVGWMEGPEALMLWVGVLAVRRIRNALRPAGENEQA